MPVEIWRSALARRADDLARIGAHEVEPVAQVDVRVDASAALPEFPASANAWHVVRNREVLWLGPDEWLVLGRQGAERKIAAELERALAGTHHSVVDVSAARTVIELGGVDRLEILSNGCGLDLHPRSWRDGMCAQTLLARIPVILQERDASTRIFVRPSLANYLLDWLLEIAGVERP